VTITRPTEPGDLSKLRARGFRAVAAQYGWDAMAKRWEAEPERVAGV